MFRLVAQYSLNPVLRSECAQWWPRGRIGKGFTKFGELAIAVALHTAASSSERIALNTVNRATENRVRREFVDEGEMLDLAKHIINTKKGSFDAFDDRYDDAVAELVKAKIEGRPLPKKKAPAPTKTQRKADLKGMPREGPDSA